MTTHQVFGQLEAAVTALPSDYTGKEGYKAWIADAKMKYATPPTDVDEYIKGLKAAGTALRGKMAVPAVPAAAPVMAAVAAAPPPAASAAPAASNVAASDAASPAASNVAASAAPAPTAEASLGLGLGSGSTPALAETLSLSSSQSEGALGLGSGSPPSAFNPGGEGAPLGSAADDAREAAEAEEGEEAAEFKNNQKEGGRGRKTRHQTPKRRTSAKNGRKGLSKKKTGSRK